MDVVRIDRPPPSLRDPVLVAAFRGWNDAGEAASSALVALDAALAAEPFAEVDPEEFFDFSAIRPTVRLEEGRRVVEWPRNAFAWAPLPAQRHGDGDGARHVVLFDGTEPSLKWRAFVDGVVGLAVDLGVRRVVTLGALQVDVPHTRALPVSGAASPPELAARFGVRRSSYEGPTGITGIFHQRCADEGLEALSMWVGIPHYLAGTSYLAGAVVLAERTLAVLDAEVAIDDLAADAAAQRDDIAELVDDDADLASYVAELEARAVDAENEPLPTVDIEVSGDEIAAQFERYLRDRDG